MRAQALTTLGPEIKIDRKYFATVGLVAVAYAVAAKFGLSLAQTTAQVTTVWPASGIALAVIIVLGRRYWPGVFLGALVANALTNEPIWVAAGIAAGNTLEAVTGAYILKRWGKFKGSMARPSVAIWYAVASVSSTAIAATIGPVFLALGGLISWDNFFHVGLVWWQGDLMGDLVFGPLLLVYFDRRSFAIFRHRLIEAGILFAATFGACIVVFTSPTTGPLGFPYLLFPFVMWAAVRFTQVGVVTGTLLIAAVSIWATANGLGTFARQSTLEENLVLLQVFISVLSATSLVFATAMAEQIAAKDALVKQAARLEQLDTEIKEANRRMTNMLAGVLDENSHRRGNDRKL